MRFPDKIDPEMRENFPFRVFIKDTYLNEGIASKNSIDQIIQETSIDNITLDDTINVPDLKGSVMVIESKDI